MLRWLPTRTGAAATSLLAILAMRAVATPQSVRVDATPGHAVNTFRPDEAFGATVDRLPLKMTDTFFRPDQIAQYLKAGWGPVSYRQNTELFVQAWHWNPAGAWSGHQQGYFTGDGKLSSVPIRHSFSYDLPRRGVTRNSGSEFDGYSRLDDGDLRTFWKSNPYLSKRFTGDDDSLHPQWVVIKLEEEQIVTAIRIAWGQPYARDYRVQYWSAPTDAMEDPASGEWNDFPLGEIRDGNGGAATQTLSRRPIAIRYVRVLMTRSSDTCVDGDSSDPRNCVGFSIREIYLGTPTSQGIHDILHHAPGQEQTFTYCSSVDPWHRSADKYVTLDHMESGDQVGFDLFYTSGITRGLPAMIPVAVLYSTPEDAAAELAYLEARHYLISFVEMGEEPDGQYVSPEDYAALYLQWATALHRIDPKLKLGGPAFQGGTEDIKFWRNADGEASWLRRFLAYLRSHNRLKDLAFFSFEHYPYYDGTCQGPWDNLFKEPGVLEHIVQVWKEDGLPQDVPMLISETNAPGADDALDVFGALWVGETFPAFLTAGGKASYYHHALPYSTPHPACANSWGTYHMFTIDSRGFIRQPVAQFFAAQLLTQEWTLPGHDEHQVYRAQSDVKDGRDRLLVTAYAVHRPDGQWALMLINKDEDSPHRVRIVFENSADRKSAGFDGPVTVITFGREQYVWHPALADGYARPDGPPVTSTLPAATDGVILPPASMSVVRGRVAE
jgi:F5/8 type C domain